MNDKKENAPEGNVIIRRVVSRMIRQAKLFWQIALLLIFAIVIAVFAYQYGPRLPLITF